MSAPALVLHLAHAFTWKQQTPGCGELTQGEIGAPVRGHQQHPALLRQRPRPALADRIGPLTPQRGDQLVELPGGSAR